jgi:hypothetical protein
MPNRERRPGPSLSYFSERKRVFSFDGKIPNPGTISRKLGELTYQWYVLNEEKCSYSFHLSFYSMNLGSSETTREPPSQVASFFFHFSDFYNSHLPPHKRKKPMKESFLQWFIGFSEGDGCFVSRKNGKRMRLSFEISQKNPRTLKRIRTELGFGRVRPCGEYFKYQVTDIAGLQRIMALFNGNLVLPKRRIQFEQWVSGITLERDMISFQHRPSKVLPSLETGWLAGFLDAEGCFYAKFTTSSSRSTLSARLDQRVTLTQQDLSGEREILFFIGKLLQTPGVPRPSTKVDTLPLKWKAYEGDTKDKNLSLAKKPNVYRLEIASCESHGILVSYLRLFPPVEKAVPFGRWLRVYNLRVLRMHLTERGIRRMRRLCDSINRDQNLEKKMEKDASSKDPHLCYESSNFVLFS